jgi:hypothetical protein
MYTVAFRGVKLLFLEESLLIGRRSLYDALIITRWTMPSESKRAFWGHRQ